MTDINSRLLATWLPLARVVLSSLIIASCGGKSASNANTSGADEGAISAGGAGNGGSAGESVASGGTCPVPAPAVPSSPSTPPSEVGCYAYINGGWQPLPCNCDLWLRNTAGGPVSVKLALAFSPADMVPSFTGSPDVEVKFEDADASWYGVWAQQAARDASFNVNNDGGYTTVRLGASSVDLDPVSMAGCESRSPTGSINAPYGTFLTLDMQATLTDAAGRLVANNTGQCSQLESHPTIRSGGFGGDASEAGSPQ